MKSAGFHLVAMTALSAALTACSFAPSYQRPDLPTPANYKEAGELQKQEWIQGKIITLAKRSDDETAILKHLK